MPTSVVIDAWHLTGPSSYRGIGTYLRNLLSHLPAAGDLDVRALTIDPSSVPAGITAVPITRQAPGRWAAREHAVRLPRDLRRAGGDVAHSPALDPPRRCHVPFVQTLHDLTPVLIDDPRFAAERSRFLRSADRYRDAAAVIAVSRDAAEKGITHLGLDRARIHVAHHGVDPRFRPADGETDAESYLLYVGEYGAHKGFAEAFAVIGQLADKGFRHRLRMIGRIAPWYAAEIERLRAESPRPDRVDLVGYVDDVLPHYQQAAALLVTSRQEGFGLPAVEAMACGTPVLGFANSATTEVVADGGVLVEDGDVAGLADAVASVLASPGARDDLAGRGRLRSRSFDWAASAAIHAEVFRSVAG